jgi:hypothetical protein
MDEICQLAFLRKAADSLLSAGFATIIADSRCFLGLLPFTENYVAMYNNEWRQVKKSGEFKKEAYRDGIKGKGGKIEMEYMKHGQRTKLSTLTPPTHHTIPILLPR